jgi:dihydrofolate reductase
MWVAAVALLRSRRPVSPIRWSVSTSRPYGLRSHPGGRVARLENVEFVVADAHICSYAVVRRLRGEGGNERENAMTARFVYWMNVSLDLVIEPAAGEQGGDDWLRIDEELHREFNERARRLSMMVEGRVIYDLMDPFWPDARTDESLPDYMREYGRIWTDKPKVLVSRTRRTASYNTSILGGEDAIDRLAELRRTGDGDIGVGGATLATALLRAQLLDELLLFTHPVLLGAGRSLFDGLDAPLQLDLLEQMSFGSGVTMHRYEVRDAAGGQPPN